MQSREYQKLQVIIEKYCKEIQEILTEELFDYLRKEGVFLSFPVEKGYLGIDVYCETEEDRKNLSRLSSLGKLGWA